MRGYWLLKEMKWLQVMRIPLGVTGGLQEKQVKREICNPRSNHRRRGLQEKQVMREICNLSEMTRKNRSRAMAAKIERGFRIIKEIIKEIINDKISI